MKCPFCRSNRTEVYNTRTTKFATQIWRRRRCASCHEAFTTYEAPDLTFLKVTHPDRKAQPYSRAKLYYALSEALQRVPRSESTIDAITDTIEAKILDTQLAEIPAEIISRIILTTLKHFNTAAFVRYLTTHTELASPAELKKALKNY
jgi:transcriptional repressor NrdR